MKRFFRAFSGICALLSMAVLWKITAVERVLPNELHLTQAQSVQLCGGEVALCPLRDNNAVREAKLWGVIPVSEIPLRDTERPYLIPGGQPFGIKLLTEGVIVTGTATQKAGVSPCEAAGVRPGDILLSINGNAVSSATDVGRILAGKGGCEVQLLLHRNGVSRTVTVRAEPDEHGDGSLGLLVRDSSAGIGTLTWYDPANGTFGGLGHGICDADTGVLLPLGSGQAVEVSISGVQPAKAGSPGELIGIFSARSRMGELTANAACGIFGDMEQAPCKGEALPVAFPQEVKPGKAQIRTTIQGKEPKTYEVEIVRTDLSAPDNHRDMVIRITDAQLLAETGGIVQGMSGSPILQDGKLVGAVTHVFVNAPDMGYGIFIENMLDAAE